MKPDEKEKEKENQKKIKKSHNKKLSSSFSTKLFVPMMALSTLQIGALFGTLYISGEFKSVRQYAYDMLIEKTENRKNYIENMFLKNTSEVYQADMAITNITEQILAENHQSIADLQTDKQINREILSQATQRLIYLLRVSGANDAFVILDTGELYARNGMENKAGIYIRDMDSYSGSTASNNDLLLEAGNSDAAGLYNITLDYEWTAQINVGTCDSPDKLDFYHKTMETAEEHKNSNLNELGYWSGFSKISGSALPSIKYTLPLISDDGSIYGVMGIGFLEKNILKNMPSNDTFSKSSCYVVGADFHHQNAYSVLVSYGSLFTRLVEDPEIIRMDGIDESKVYTIGETSDKKSVGNIQLMDLYSEQSPYLGEQWALISIADRDKILSVYTRLLKMLIMSSTVSIILVILLALLVDRIVTNPVKKIVQELEKNPEENQIIRFSSSGISEIDTLTQAIEELQINVREQASRVSKVISMVNMGIGVFMCDLDTMSVYVGESLIKLLSLHELYHLPVTDTCMPFDKFREYLAYLAPESKMRESKLLEMFSLDAETVTREVEIKHVNTEKNITKWYKFALHRDHNNILGLVQDITGSILEKKKIEYERDYDLTTGLLNRRAYYSKIGELFNHPENLKIAAFLMID
ncbi:MAG: hypothetical protein K2H82_00325, partial [Oscillospiraceae bacterium]|nr:hypothetical protein [Oscillospiraceae bacterium]